MMYISKQPYWLSDDGIKKVEKDYKAIYMGYWCTKHSNGWWNDYPVDVFYVEHPDRSKKHSNYFGIFIDREKLYITDAESAFQDPIIGLLTDDDEVIVSKYRHDCVVKGDHMIDGGRDYLKRSLNSKQVKVDIVGSEFVFEIMP